MGYINPQNEDSGLEPLKKDVGIELSPTGEESALDIGDPFKKFEGLSNTSSKELPSVEQRAAYHFRGGPRPRPRRRHGYIRS